MLPINGLLSAANNVPSMFDFIVEMLFLFHFICFCEKVARWQSGKLLGGVHCHGLSV